MSRYGIDRILTSVAFRRTRLPAYLALLVVVTAWVFAEQQNADVYRQNLRAEVLNQVSLIRAKLEGHINGNIQLVRGLIATISTEPDMDQERFATLASKLLREAPQVSHIAAAPELVVRLIYPLEGNERAIGLDYNLHEQQREAALRARDTGQMVLAGPVDLVQGGKGFIARFPSSPRRMGRSASGASSRRSSMSSSCTATAGCSMTSFRSTSLCSAAMRWATPANASSARRSDPPTIR